MNKIGRGLHKAIGELVETAANQTARVVRSLNQYKVEINPNTLGMNGGNIRIVRKGRMRRMDPGCFNAARYARDKAPGDPARQRDIMREYARQLNDQQNGLNDLTVGEYMDARDAYIDLTRGGISNGQAQRDAGKALEARITRNITETNQKRGMSQGQAERAAKARARQIMGNLAALHNPDMIAGGRDQIVRVGHSGVNSSIGGEWGRHEKPNSRIAKIDAAAREAAADPRLGCSAKMNVRLQPCRG